MSADPKESETEKMKSDNSKVSSSVELLSTDPGRYGKIVAQEAFDYFVANRNRGSGPGDKSKGDNN